MLSFIGSAPAKTSITNTWSEALANQKQEYWCYTTPHYEANCEVLISTIKVAIQDLEGFGGSIPFQLIRLIDS